MKTPGLLAPLFACALILSASVTPPDTAAQQIVKARAGASAAAALE